MDIVWEVDNLELNRIFKRYQELEREFAQELNNLISTYLPEDFDVKILRLDNVMPEILWNSESRNKPKSITKIESSMCVDVRRAYKILSPLNGKKFGEFEIEVKSFNLEDEAENFHTVHFIVHKNIDNYIDVETAVVWDKNAKKVLGLLS